MSTEDKNKFQHYSWLQRIGWLIFIWFASVMSLAVVALVIRAVMTVAGMKSS